MITEAKSEYKSNLALAYAHYNDSRIFQYISSIKDNDRYPTPIFYNDKQAFYLFLFIYQGFTAQVLKVCRTSGPTAC